LRERGKGKTGTQRRSVDHKPKNKKPKQDCSYDFWGEDLSKAIRGARETGDLEEREVEGSWSLEEVTGENIVSS